MTAFLATIAVLAIAVVVWFGTIQERRTRDLGRRLADVERDRTILRQRIVAIACDIDRRWAEQAYEQTMSGRRQPVPHVPARVLLSDDARADDVRDALLAAADEVGFEVAYEHPAGRRPYSSWIVLRQRRADEGPAAQRLADLGDDIRRAVRDPRPDGPDLPALTLRSGPAVVQLGLGVLVSDGKRVVYASLSTAQARALEDEREVFQDPAGLLARLTGDPAYRVDDLTDRGPSLPVRPRRPERAAGSAPAPVGAGVAGGASGAASGAASGGSGGGGASGAGGTGADDAVDLAVTELGRLATRVAQLAGDRPASPATLRALDDVRRRITRLSDQVGPPDAPRSAAGSRLLHWRDRVLAATRTRSSKPRPPGPGGLAAELKSVADALRGDRAPADGVPADRAAADGAAADRAAADRAPAKDRPKRWK